MAETPPLALTDAELISRPSGLSILNYKVEHFFALYVMPILIT